MVRLPRVVQQLDRREDVDVVYMISDYEWRYALLFLSITKHPIRILSHHDRCRVGSVRLSDSVAKKPISA